MTYYVVYDTSTGQILRSGQCSSEDLLLQATSPDLGVLETDSVKSDVEWRVVNNQLQQQQEI